MKYLAGATEPLDYGRCRRLEPGGRVCVDERRTEVEAGGVLPALRGAAERAAEAIEQRATVEDDEGGVDRGRDEHGCVGQVGRDRYRPLQPRYLSRGWHTVRQSAPTAWLRRPRDWPTHRGEHGCVGQVGLHGYRPLQPGHLQNKAGLAKLSSGSGVGGWGSADGI